MTVPNTHDIIKRKGKLQLIMNKMFYISDDSQVSAHVQEPSTYENVPSTPDGYDATSGNTMNVSMSNADNNVHTTDEAFATEVAPEQQQKHQQQQQQPTDYETLNTYTPLEVRRPQETAQDASANASTTDMNISEYESTGYYVDSAFADQTGNSESNYANI